MANQYTTDHIEVDTKLYDDFNDGYFSASSCDTSMRSITSSINEYIIAYGRRYHSYYGNDKNLLPTDEIEQDRLDLHHEIMRVLLGDLTFVPLNNPQRILDVGTGTGIWAVEIAEKYNPSYPNAEVIGIDLSPIQHSFAPRNCSFQVDDAELEWTMDESSYDFIHVRNLAQAIVDMPQLLSQAYRTLVPGGWVEHGEIDVSVRTDENGGLPDSHPTKIWIDNFETAIKKTGRTLPTPESMKQEMEDAGFVDVKMMVKKQPVGPWPKDPELKYVGAMTLLASESGMDSYSLMLFTRVLGMDVEDAKRITRMGLAPLKLRSNRFYCYYYVVAGRKPE